jgi:hypothetical protein
LGRVPAGGATLKTSMSWEYANGWRDVRLRFSCMDA